MVDTNGQWNDVDCNRIGYSYGSICEVGKYVKIKVIYSTERNMKKKIGKF